MKRSVLYKFREFIEKGATSLTDTEALEAVALFPAWAVGVAYAKDERVQFDGKLYKVVQAHTSQADWTPDIANSLFEVVAKPDQGDTPDDPIPYSGNMALKNGKYYSQYDVVYVCFRGSGIPVYADLKDLVDHYVHVWEG